MEFKRHRPNQDIWPSLKELKKVPILESLPSLTESQTDLQKAEILEPTGSKELRRDEISTTDPSTKQSFNLANSSEPIWIGDLPPEILGSVLEQLTPNDVKQLSVTGSTLRSRVLPHLMKNIVLTWVQLLELHSTLPVGAQIDHFRHHVRQIRISPANAYNEYQMDTFGKLLSPKVFPSLRSVVVHSLNSSYWLKYNHCSHITHLTLYSDPVAPASGIKNFHLSHVAGLTNLQSLSLHNYHFSQPESSSSPITDYSENSEQSRSELSRSELPRSELSESEFSASGFGIVSLELHDCTWEYPFSLSSFNPNGRLRSLVLSLSKDNSFVLSERFVDFLKTPFSRHPSSLRHLRIAFDDSRYKNHLTSAILANILNTFTHLERLQLHGWSAYLAVLKEIICCHQFRTPLELSVKIESVGSMSMEKFLNIVKEHPNLIVRAG